MGRKGIISFALAEHNLDGTGHLFILPPVVLTKITFWLHSKSMGTGARCP